VVVREHIREYKTAVGKQLIELPGYTMRVFVTDLESTPETIWRDYNKRADVENRIAELKHDMAADRFCLQEFYASEAAFRSILLLFNLLSEFQRASGTGRHREPGTLRSQVLLCVAELGEVGHQIVLCLSSSWGGLINEKSNFGIQVQIVKLRPGHRPVRVRGAHRPGREPAGHSRQPARLLHHGHQRST
jgi:Transposase DDE domain group 1